jgi:hypothetical protein
MEEISSGRVPAEPGKVDVSKIWEREYWMGVFAVSEQQLQEAVAAVGGDTEAVKAYFDRTAGDRSTAQGT